MFHRLKLFVLILIAVPATAEAAVTIHEVAWMGDSTSANHEWIELYNSGEAAVSLEGWTLSDGMNLEITLTGTLASGRYGVLERTSEESAPGTAFFVYAGALVNTGATLTLRDGGGAIQDQVPGGEEWQNIGGDNTSKETAQYTPLGWITAPATPGRSNAEEGNVKDDEVEPVTPSAPAPRAVVTNRSSNAPVLVRTTKSGLVTAVTGPTQTYVNQPVTFTVAAVGAGQTIISSLKHGWNFGDTYTASGTSVVHTYQYPGTYVVTVGSKYAKHEVTARHEVTVLPVTVSLGRTAAGDIVLNNDSPYELDISGYVVRGTEELVIPPSTIVLTRGTITIPRSRVERGDVRRLVMLHDAAGQLVTSTGVSPRDGGTESEESFIPVAAKPLPLVSSDRGGVVARESTSPSLFTVPVVYATTATTLTDQISPTAPASDNPPPRWPYVALIVVIGGALFAIFRSPRTTLDRDSTTS